KTLSWLYKGKPLPQSQEGSSQQPNRGRLCSEGVTIRNRRQYEYRYTGTASGTSRTTRGRGSRQSKRRDRHIRFTSGDRGRRPTSKIPWFRASAHEENVRSSGTSLKGSGRTREGE